jgi:hypothetical protein
VIRHARKQSTKEQAVKAGYSLETLAAVALSAATAKSVLTVIAPAQFGIDLTQVRISFDGVTASAVPVLVEICQNTLATNSTVGTANTTAGPPVQVYGRTIVAGFTGFYNSTSEPTVLTPYDRFTITPNGGTYVYDIPKDRTPDTPVSAGLTIRCTAPAAVNVNATMLFERC